MPRQVEALVIHHSAGLWGDRAWIDGLHKQRGWRGIGYHKLILNGYPTYRDWTKEHRIADQDGLIAQGRPDTETGAHCPGWNTRSLGICLVGNFMAYPPTPAQWDSLVDACARLCRRYSITADHIFGHGQLRATDCPGRLLDMDKLRCEVIIRMRQG